MTFDKELLSKFAHIDEQDEYKRNESIQIGFEHELKSITVRLGDSARFEAKIRLISVSQCQSIDLSLLKIEWRLNDICITTNENNSRYQFGSIPEENRYWMDIQQCQQQDEKVYTIYISYDDGKLHDESSAYLFVDSFTTDQKEQPVETLQRGLDADNAWSSATSLDRFTPPTIIRPLLSAYQYHSGEQLHFLVEYISPSAECHCTWQVQLSNDIIPRSVEDGLIVNADCSSILIIDSITPQLQGLYTFNVENIYGSTMTQTIVIVHTHGIDEDTKEIQGGIPKKKKKIEEYYNSNPYYVNGSRQKHSLMVHDIPSSESSEYGDFEVYNLTERSKDTDLESLTSRMSITAEQNTVLPIDKEQKQQDQIDVTSSVVKDLYGQRHIAYFDPSLKFEHDESSEQSENEIALTGITMNNHRMKYGRDSSVRIKFEVPPPPPIDDNLEEHIYEDIPNTISIPQSSATVSLQQQSTKTTDKDFIASEQTQFISSSPTSFDEALGDVEQWSDVIDDNDAHEPSSPRRSSQISYLPPSANEYVDEQYMAYSVKQPLAVSSVEVLDKMLSIMLPESNQDVPLLDEINVALSQLHRSKMSPTSVTMMNGFDKSAQEIPNNVNHVLPPKSDTFEQQIIFMLKPSITADIPISDESVAHLDQFHYPTVQQGSTTLHTTRSALASDVEFEELPCDLRDQPRLIKNHAVFVETDKKIEVQSIAINQRQQEEKGKSVSSQPSINANVGIGGTRVENEFSKTKDSVVNDISVLNEGNVPLPSRLLVDVLPPVEDISRQHNQLVSVLSDQRIHEVLDREFSTKPTPHDLSPTEETFATIAEEKLSTPILHKNEEKSEILLNKVDSIDKRSYKIESNEQKTETIIITTDIRDTTNHMTSLESDVQQTQDADTNGHSSIILRTNTSEKVQGESVESLSVPAQPDLLPLATMPDQTANRAIQDVLLASLESAKVTHIDGTIGITSTTSSILPEKPSTLSISKDHDEFFDIECESITEITKTDVTPIVSSDKPSITLAEAEKLQHDAAIERKDDDFYEPELDLPSIKGETNRLSPLPPTTNKKNETENVVGKPIEQLPTPILVELFATTKVSTSVDKIEEKPVNKKKAVASRTAIEKNEESTTISTEKSKSKSINKQKTIKSISNVPTLPTELTASVDKKEEESVDQAFQQISPESRRSASSDVENKKISEVQSSNKLFLSQQESPQIEAIEISSPDLQIPQANQELLRPKFSLRLKPMITINDGDHLKLEVHFIAQPDPIITWYFKSDILIPSSNVHIDQSRDISILTIDKISTQYDGRFKVILKNNLGEAVSAAQVNVKRASIAIQLQAPSKKTNVGKATTSSIKERVQA